MTLSRPIDDDDLLHVARHLPGMMYRAHFDGAGRIVRYSFVGEGLRRVYGLEPEQLERDPTMLVQMRHPDDVRRVDAVVVPSLRAGLPLAVEFRIVRPDGEVRWVQMSSSQTSVSPDERVRVGVVLDVTPQRQAEASLQRSEARWKLALDALGDGVWDWNLQTGEEVLSPRCLEMYGLDPAATEPHHRTLDERTHPDDLAGMARDRADHLEGRKPLYVNEHRIRCSDGGWKWILTRGIVIERDEAGQPVRMIGTHTDITARKESEALRQARDRAEAAHRAMTLFLSRVSHELRTPLNAILGFAQLMESDPETPAHQQPWSRELLASGRHLLAMVDDILDLSGAQSGELRLEPTAVDLQDVVAECRAMLECDAAGRQIAWVSEWPAQGARVHADRKRVKQIVVNLLSNAVKYSHVGGRIELQSRRDGDRVLLTVADEGVGIPPARFEQLFQPFQRLGAQGGRASGTGLGLALSRQLARAMGGDIEAAPRPERGTCFTLQLPAA